MLTPLDTELQLVVFLGMQLFALLAAYYFYASFLSDYRRCRVLFL